MYLLIRSVLYYMFRHWHTGDNWLLMLILPVVYRLMMLRQLLLLHKHRLMISSCMLSFHLRHLQLLHCLLLRLYLHNRSSLLLY